MEKRRIELRPAENTYVAPKYLKSKKSETNPYFDGAGKNPYIRSRRKLPP